MHLKLAYACWALLSASPKVALYKCLVILHYNLYLENETRSLRVTWNRKITAYWRQWKGGWSDILLHVLVWFLQSLNVVDQICFLLLDVLMFDAQTSLQFIGFLRPLTFLCQQSSLELQFPLLLKSHEVWLRIFWNLKAIMITRIQIFLNSTRVTCANNKCQQKAPTKYCVQTHYKVNSSYSCTSW